MKRENGLDLWIRWEPPKSVDTIMQHRAFVNRDKVVEFLSPIHRHVVHAGLQYFGEIKEEALSAAKLRWNVSSNEVKNREPFGFKNFQAATFKLERYARIIMNERPSCLFPKIKLGGLKHIRY